MKNRTVHMLLNSYPSISEKFIINQVRGLHEANITVKVISLLTPDLSRTHREFDEAGGRDNLIVIGIPRSLKKRILKAVPLFIKHLILHPRKLFTALDRKKYSTAAGSLKNLYVMDRLMGEKINLLHAHFGPNGLVGAFLKDMGMVNKLLVTFHGSDINSYPRRYGQNIYRYMYDRTDLITVNTSFTGKKVTANGADPANIAILPVGLDAGDYPQREDPPCSGGDLRILTVGRLVEKKGYPFMIEAVKTLIEQFPCLTYHIVGDGPLRDELQELVHRESLDDHIVFRGLLDADQVRVEYARAHVFVLPSVTASSGDMEGQGLVLQEAQAMGVPVVSTLHNGIPDGVLDGESGFLVPEKDSPALARALTPLLECSDLRQKTGRAGAAFVRENYNIPVLTEKLMGLYQSLEAFL